MPKLKTHRGAAKRFKTTGSGEIKRSKANRRHILTTKSKKRKRALKSPALVDKTQIKNIKLLLPYLN
ncbi:MAG: 50S ribosomal protein L35 [Thermodesulfovibrionales bacterium]